MEYEKRRFFSVERIEDSSRISTAGKTFQWGASEMQEIFKIGQTFKIINEIAMGQDFEISFIS